MSKAIQGVAALGGAVLIGVAEFALASTGVGLAALPALMDIQEGLVVGGLAMLAGAAASALTSNRGTNITTRQAAAYRQIIYGEQRVGGISVYQSTTGSTHNQYNYVIVIAGHECDSIVNLYLDGRQVFWQGSGVGNSTRNGVNFGGNPDGNNHTGPGGQQYNFGGLVYCEACYGDQTANPNTVPGGGYNTGLNANDPVWGPSPQGLPYLGGCTYVYLKVEYNPAMFPSAPEIRFTVRGKNNIWDPRTQSRGYTTNWALIVADVFTDSQFGLGDNTVNQPQLIAAANVCDEQVPLAAGGTESRYCCADHYDSSTAPGAALARMLPAAAGRFARSGGEWYIFPAYWQGPSFAFDDGALASEFTWNPTRDRRDLFNRITGTYTAPNYPYNATTETGSNLYDKNGFYDGTIQNNFAFAFQPASIPYYAADVLHGYAANQYLNEDGGVLLQRDVQLPCVLSIAQAQRVLKIILEKNRRQGTGTLMMFPAAYQMMQMDVMSFTMPSLGWTEKVLEVNSIALGLAPGKNGIPTPQVKVSVNETDASVYEWSVSEELNIYLTEIAPQQSYIPAAPQNLVLTSSAATALIGLDGIARPRVELSWDTPEDVLTQTIQMQMQGPIVAGQAVPGWVDYGSVSVQSNSAYIADVISGQEYNFRIRGARANGAVSPWTEIDGYTVGVTLSQLAQLALAPGTLIGEAFGDGTAALIVEPFTATIGNASVAVLPAGEVTLAGLAQGRLYFVYYVDPTFAGGAIAPIATQNQADYLNKQGYFLIDSKVTPTAAASTAPGAPGTSAWLSPSQGVDNGTRTTQSPAAAYDGNESTSAIVSASATSSGSTYGSCTWSGWPQVTASSSAQLVVEGSLATAMSGTITGEGNVGITMSIAGTTTALVSGSSGYTAAVPAGTDLSTISVTVSVNAQADDTDTPSGSKAPTGQITAKFSIPEIKITP